MSDIHGRYIMYNGLVVSEEQVKVWLDRAVGLELKIAEKDEKLKRVRDESIDEAAAECFNTSRNIVESSISLAVNLLGYRILKLKQKEAEHER